MKGTRVLFLSVVGLSCAFAVGCGGGSSNSSASNSSSSNTIATSGANVAPIAVNGGPPGANYADAAFISVTVCTPGTTTCQTIPNILVDTGSVGLRIISSQLTVSLPQQNASDGNPMAECLQFLGSYTWGPVQTAEVQIAGETASSVPIQVLSDTTAGFPTPTSCSEPSGTLESSADTVETLGAYGILGVGTYAQDCGGGCIQADNLVGTSPPPFYYECPAGSCAPAWQNLAQQVANPVSLFATDNNGVIVELPSVSASGQATATGSLVFGIGTQSNNGLGSATVYSIDYTTGNFTTTFNTTTFSDRSFIDSGSNGYFFPDSSITACPTGENATAPGFYCPSSTLNLTATNEGAAYQATPTGSGTVNFSIENAINLFQTSDEAFNDLGGGEVSDGSGASNYFDWGLPFFFGRNVYVSIYGATAPGGTTPYWAY